MKQLTLKNPMQLGDRDPKYGQAYWSFTHDQQEPVMFNLMEGGVGDGTVITAETVELKQSKKGTDYHRLKKVQVLGQTQVTTNKPTDMELVISELKSLQNEVREIKALLRADSVNPIKKEEPQQDTVVDDFDTDEPIDLSDIPF